MFRIVIAMLVIGGFLIFMGVQEARLSSSAKSQPQTITVGELATNGYGDNSHVILTDYFIWGPGVLMEWKENKPNTYTRVWLPALAMDGEFATKAFTEIQAGKSPDDLAPPKEVDVIIISKKLKNDRAVENFMDKDQCQGLLVNATEGFDKEELAYLKKDFPGTDFKKVWILELERKPAGMAKMGGFLGGGGLLVLLGLGLGFKSMTGNN